MQTVKDSSSLRFASFLEGYWVAPVPLWVSH